MVSNPFIRLPEQKHIAVLPFQNIGNDATNQAFTDGVVESLTSKLSQLQRFQQSFWIVPSSDARKVKSLDDAYHNLTKGVYSVRLLEAKTEIPGYGTVAPAGSPIDRTNA